MVKMTPRGCFKTLKHCEEKIFNNEIDEEVRQAKVHKVDQVVKHSYIDFLLRGLDRVTKNSYAPTLRDPEGLQS